jgi:hypothetical protein
VKGSRDRDSCHDAYDNADEERGRACGHCPHHEASKPRQKPDKRGATDRRLRFIIRHVSPIVTAKLNYTILEYMYTEPIASRAC